MGIEFTWAAGISFVGGAVWAWLVAAQLYDHVSHCRNCKNNVIRKLRLSPDDENITCTRKF
jgi:hypothetical protein